jgi:hypothetical protein
MFCHGENDNDVPIAEAEQFYIALQDVGVETAMVRTRGKATEFAKSVMFRTGSAAAFPGGTTTTSARGRKKVLAGGGGERSRDAAIAILSGARS